MSNVFNYQYSIFGNFVETTNNIQDIAKKLENYRREVTNLVSPIGQQQSLYVFSSPEIGLRITLDRIDFLFSEPSDNDIEQIDNAFGVIFNSKCFGKVNRVAINYSRFVKENYKDRLAILKKNISLLKCNDECKEVNIRYNYASFLNDIPLNNIASIQNIVIQDSRNFESFPVILFSLDINTVVSSQANFDSHHILSLFNELKTMAEKEMVELMKSARH